MFHSRLELLALRSQEKDLVLRTDTLAVRRELHDFLKNDLIYFLQKSLSRKNFISDKFTDTAMIHRVFVGMLKEFRASSLFPAGKDFSEPSIPEKWYHELARGSDLTERKIINYLNIYRHQIYALLDEVSDEYQDLRPLARNLFLSPDYEISFEEAYNAEIILREEIQFTLLRNFSRHHRLEYLVGKEIVTQITDRFIHILHEEMQNHMASLLERQKTLTSQILVEKGSLDTEIRDAGRQHSRQIQQEIPNEDPRIQFRVAYDPLRMVGGDFYRIIRVDERTFALFLADIAGHGIGAALYLNTLKNVFEDNIKYVESPARLMKHLNERLCGRIGDNFVTALSVVVDLKKRRLTYCNAGHPKGFLYALAPLAPRSRFLRPNSKVIGIFPRQKFRDSEVPLLERCRLVLYTDGLTETFNETGVMLGERRFMNLFRDTRELDLEKTLARVEDALREFRGAGRVEDDRSMILADILPGSGG